ncbi:hypothetical protein [Lysobacter gummosus]|uniref:hypothetical protein n=1 Tax=Lysobacter gummosus TaxID=262324 RepID=UPI003643175B
MRWRRVPPSPGDFNTRAAAGRAPTHAGHAHGPEPLCGPARRDTRRSIRSPPLTC